MADPIHALIFGDVSVGKTGQIGTWPLPRVLDFDARARVLLARLYPNNGIVIEKFEEHTDSRGVIRKDSHFALDDACRVFDRWCLEHTKWGTLVVDTGTMLTTLANNKAVIFNQELGLSQTFEQAQKWGAVLPKIQDYGVERNITEQFVAMCLAFCQKQGKHFLFLCHENEKRNKEGVTVAIAPLLTGKSAAAIPAMFSEVWNMRARKESTGTGPDGKPLPAVLKRFFQTEPDGFRICRSDMGVPTGTNANYDAVMASLKRS